MSSTIIFVGLPEDSKSSIIRKSSGSVTLWPRSNVEMNIVGTNDGDPQRSEVQASRQGADLVNEMMASRNNAEANVVIDSVLQPFAPSEALDENGCLKTGGVMAVWTRKNVTMSLLPVKGNIVNAEVLEGNQDRQGSEAKEIITVTQTTVDQTLLKHLDGPCLIDDKSEGSYTRPGSETNEHITSSSSSRATADLSLLKHSGGQGLVEDKYKGSKRRVPNAPKSSIAEIFNSDQTDGSPIKNGTTRPRVVRDTPTRPRDTHSRLFGQVRANNPVSPMVTDTIRSNIHFGDNEVNGITPSQSPSKQLTNLTNGSTASTPSRGEPAHAGHLIPKRNPVTGDGVTLPTQRRRHPATNMRGADLPPDDPYYQLLEPQPTHRYYTRDWPPKPADYYVESTTKPSVRVRQTPYTLLGLQTDDPEKPHPVIDPDSFSPQLVMDKHWPPFPAQHYLEPKEHKMLYHPLPPYAFVGMHSALGERPMPDYKYDPVPALDGQIDPFLIAHTDPPPTLFKYERDGPIPDVIPLQTSLAPGPRTLTGFPPIFHKHVPGYLFDRNRHGDDLRPKTYYVDYVRRREMEGNPITGDGYKSMNGQINTVTSVNGTSHMILHCRVPPGGYSSGLW